MDGIILKPSIHGMSYILYIFLTPQETKSLNKDRWL